MWLAAFDRLAPAQIVVTTKNRNATQAHSFPALLLLFLVAVSSTAVSGADSACRPPALAAASREANFFSEQQEVELGEIVAEHIGNNFRVINDENLTAPLRRVIDNLLRHSPPTQLNVRVFLIDLPDVNAFVLPGGRMYVSRKLVAFAQTEDELAGVVSHELGHLLARQPSINVTEEFQKVLGVTSVGDRADILDKYNRLMENAARKPDVLRKIGRNSEKDQMTADQIGLYALAAAGYDPEAHVHLFDRATEGKGKTGNFFTDLFGSTRSDSKRLREMIKANAGIPAACMDPRRSISPAAFHEWQTAVVNYSDVHTNEALHGVLARIKLDPPIRMGLTNIRFSPDGAYVLAQDESSITVLRREPLTNLFQIPATDAHQARFTPDSKAVVFHTDGLRIEKWNIQQQAKSEAHEVSVRMRADYAFPGRRLARVSGWGVWPATD